MPEQLEGLTAAAEVSALAELALCENLSQTSGWAARWSSQVSGADGALLWAPDAVHPLFLCIGAHGEGTQAFLTVASLLGITQVTVSTTNDDLGFALYGGAGATPLPAALPLFATGLGVLALLGWRRKRKAAAKAV